MIEVVCVVCCELCFITGFFVGIGGLLRRTTVKSQREVGDNTGAFLKTNICISGTFHTPILPLQQEI